jgi:hypothetical protein
VALVKLFICIIVATSIILSGLTPAFGFRLFEGSKTNSVNRWPYSFGDRYIYDNAGSSWNYDSGYRSKRQPKYWQPRFEYKYNYEGHSDEKFQDLIEHFSKDQLHPKNTYDNDPICR